MNSGRLNEIRSIVKGENPLVHAITNPISINQCANTILAVGARPIMAEHPCEAEEIAKTSKSLVLNLGNITDVRMESMMLSAKTANENTIPVIIDAVGVACSELRRKFAEHLLGIANPSIIKGNYSEINALCNLKYKSLGVDAESTIDINYIVGISASLALKYNTVVLASGKTDVITDGRKVVFIKNGTPQLATVTGTGCMLGMLCGCYLSVGTGVEAAVTASGVLGISGELSETDNGVGSFMVNLLDKLSTLTDGELEKHLKTEEFKIEKP